ncbi:hypothetical protein [Pseudomonas syringae]|nr:hypothetical protein [Pseudomonas syringae]
MLEIFAAKLGFVRIAAIEPQFYFAGSLGLPNNPMAQNHAKAK